MTTPRPFAVAPHDPAWRRGAALADRPLDALRPHAPRVEHIGSTSSPEMAAKPVFEPDH